MNVAGAYKVSAVFFVIVVQITDVLEIVGVQIAGGYAFVRKNVIIIFYDFQSIALFLEVILDNFQNFRMRSRCCSYLDNFVVSAFASSSPPPQPVSANVAAIVSARTAEKTIFFFIVFSFIIILF